MPRIVNVQFREGGKAYYFDPLTFDLHNRDHVIVSTTKGLEFGTVINEIHDIPCEMVQYQLKPVLRMASKEDINKAESNKVKEKKAFRVGQTKIEEHRLDMILVDVEYSFDDSKIVFYFTADGRVDFRELVKDLAGVFRNRIELRQIGVRDEAKMIGGLGICGRELCCCSFLNEFSPVSVKMAKEQNLSMNPAKISGACGRLMCCLRYEQAAYEDANYRMPRKGTPVDTPAGRGIVEDTDILREIVKVRLDQGDDPDWSVFKLEEISFENRKTKKPQQRQSCPKNQNRKKATSIDKTPPVKVPETSSEDINITVDESK